MANKNIKKFSYNELHYIIIKFTIISAIFPINVNTNPAKNKRHALRGIEEKEICDLVLSIEGVKGCHKIRTRGSMGDIRVDMHLLVQPDLKLEDAHLIAHRVSKKLKGEYKDVSDVVVHLEPFIGQPQESNTKKTS